MDSLISVSAEGVTLPNASGPQITFNTRYPFWKLDSLNPVSFETFTILLNVEPPNPDGVTTFYKRNLIYSYPHGYNYVPSTWFLVSVPGYTPFYGPPVVAGNFPFPVGFEGVYLTGGGSFPTYASSVFIVTVDKTNINFYCDKFYDPRIGALPAPQVIGMFLVVRSYISVCDLSGTDVPTHP